MSACLEKNFPFLIANLERNGTGISAEESAK